MYQRQRILGFDGLRALAVCGVFLQHNAHITVASLGQLGVWAFFALSGYLITGILHGQRRRIDAGQSSFKAELKRFLWRRTLRIFPIYYLLLIVLSAMVVAGHLPAEFKASLPWHFAYLSNFWIGHAGFWPGPFSHLWSLAVEEQFYLLYAPVLLLLPLRRQWWAGAVLLAAGVVSMWLFKARDVSPVLFLAHPLTNFWVLALGALAFYLVGDPGSRWRRAFTGRMAWPALVLALAGIAASTMFRAPDAWRDLGPAGYACSALVLGVCMAGFVAWLACNQGSRLVRVLELAPLAGLGRISYGFYLYHLAAPLLLDWIYPTTPGSPAHAVLVFVLTLVLAKLSFVLIEAPIIRLKGPDRDLSVARLGKA